MDFVLRICFGLLMSAILLFAISQEQREIQTLKKNKEFAKALQKLENEYKDTTFYYEELALMYEKGQGVPKNMQKAIELYEIAADYDKAYSNAKLGYLYEKGEHVPQDRRKAFDYFYKAALLGNGWAMSWLGTYYYKGQGGVEKNHSAAKQWMQKAAKKHKWAKERLKEWKFDTSPILEKRKSQILSTPKYQRLFGLLFGKELFSEFNMEGAFSHVGKKIYYHFYPMVFLDSDMDLKSYYRDDSFYVDVTPKSRTVYHARAEFRFKSPQECEKKMQTYLKSVKNSSTKKVKSYTPSIEDLPYTRYLDIGVNTSPTLQKFPLTVEKPRNLQGIRHIAMCSKFDTGVIAVIDFDSYALNLAEELALHRFDDFYLNQKFRTIQEYLKPFGLSFLMPKPTSVQSQITHDTMKDELSYKKFSFTPKKATKAFDTYSMLTSSLSQRVYEIQASKTFKDYEMCLISMGTFAEQLFKRYSKSDETLMWYFYKDVGKKAKKRHTQFMLTPQGALSKIPSTKSFHDFFTPFKKQTQDYYNFEKKSLHVELGCEEKKGWLRMTNPFGKMIKEYESYLLFDNSYHKRRSNRDLFTGGNY